MAKQPDDALPAPLPIQFLAVLPLVSPPFFAVVETISSFPLAGLHILIVLERGIAGRPELAGSPVDPSALLQLVAHLLHSADDPQQLKAITTTCVRGRSG